VPEGAGDHDAEGAAMTTTRTRTAQGLDLYEGMQVIRLLEQRLQILYNQGVVQGPAHLSIGHEAIAVGAASVLRREDCTIGTYRGHGHVLARGAPPEAVLAEALGRATGLCGGKGGSMHITDVTRGYYGSYAIIGAQIPIAVGMAWAARIRSSGQVVVCFFGDGATNIGAFHEAVNLAAVWRLPVVFVCENNSYMEYTRIADVVPVPRPAADRAAAYGLRELAVDGNDVEAVAATVGTAVEAARRGEGPALVEAVTYRTCGHSAADPQAYRAEEEVAQWRDERHDPLLRYRAVLAGRGIPAEDIDAAEARARDVVAAATRAAKDAPPPDLAAAYTDVWAREGTSWRN
jgi:pyruvate dehydrogenase E1 component alpha subunit